MKTDDCLSNIATMKQVIPLLESLKPRTGFVIQRLIADARFILEINENEIKLQDKNQLKLLVP